MEAELEYYRLQERNNMPDFDVNPHHLKNKINLLTHLLDLEVITDLSTEYDTLWTNMYRKCNKELSVLTVGDLHAYAVNWQGKLYAWGANDKGQLGCSPMEYPYKINTISLSTRLKNVYAG